jgi:hypothetical protein
MSTEGASSPAISNLPTGPPDHPQPALGGSGYIHVRPEGHGKGAIDTAEGPQGKASEQGEGSEPDDRAHDRTVDRGSFAPAVGC